ncbi:MAG: radical SAM protein [Nitrospirae bacterium]|nr:MAG: radical SAM protein [Nitrospirota bacterium]
MKVCEIFTSIQGESTYAGLPCTFVRLTGCNLRCSYCDTQYAFEEGAAHDIGDIIALVRKAGIPLVEITGGEPLMQKAELQLLVSRLLDSGFQVLIETNGSQNVGGIDVRAVIILDLKTPGSGMGDMNDFSNIACLKPADEVKFVICDRADYVWAKDVIGRYDLQDRCTVLLSPAIGRLEPRLLSEWIIQDRLRVRLNLQLHKYIFGLNERGV